jgi:hypothetical protein
MGVFMVVASLSVAVKAYIDYPPRKEEGALVVFTDGTPTGIADAATPIVASPAPVLSIVERAALLSPARIATIGAIGAVTGFASGFLVRLISHIASSSLPSTSLI